MGAQVVMGAMLQCSFGMAPSSLMVLPVNRIMATTPAANIMDNKPFLNVLPFGMCQSLANPMVAAATAAAFGVLTPMPCIPATAAPWVPGCPKVLIGNMPALESNSKCMCNWGGVIQVVSPGQMVAIDG
ncbi:DUF4280 domain-containing protein [Corallococcus sp. CA049B]|uniref:DUF4280 domain-containing protein n=1 Tax=Corallococcus coralloides (strain ATCC 25202 / DSM 2259 / NBRC 100086 / M2) TaxID=1144275 RepID=H8MXD1_CORCM|nr:MULTISPECIES: DUF4280 domain-containing protein [Corallococcus]AFE05656.1 hypothetical protein COCOR_04138 [Corallococcus coralloides DSM 2259]NOJ95867.1 DUF4280 domain-containing protein [Corallococcus coralloides]RKG85933.1 DUF4280 domain-containing protein [Corallococcus sp. CA049B]